VFLFVEQQHYPKCPNYPVVCPNKCTKNTIKRIQLQKHFGDCPNAMVTCPFSEIGCKAKMKRRNLKEHHDSNFSQHQTFISTAISALQKDGTTIKKDFQLNSQQTSTQLELTKGRISSLEERCSNLEQELHDITDEVKTQNEQLTEELDQIRNYMEYLFTNYTELHEENELLRHELDSSQSKCSALEIKVGELKCHLAKVLAKTNQLSAVRNAEMKESLSKFMAETKEIQEVMTNRITSLECNVSIMSQNINFEKEIQVEISTEHT